LSLALTETPPPPSPSLLPYTTLFRSQAVPGFAPEGIHLLFHSSSSGERAERVSAAVPPPEAPGRNPHEGEPEQEARTRLREKKKDRKSTRLNSSHLGISYAVFCLKKK